ncbi:MAG: anthrone oxygenase family protein [Pseudomonadota bacterium]|nr:anthrone oxygenase family protein [Pseudomonadota bacterium]
MDLATTMIATAALMGSALIGGVFFAFSSFVMKALARVPAPQGIAAMQSINVVVINRSFLGTFMGTAALSFGLVVTTLVFGNGASTAWFVAGAFAYILGTFLVTLWANVPLNNRLAAASPTHAESHPFWRHYVTRWTLWNHVRTLAAITAALLFAIGLAQPAIH